MQSIYNISYNIAGLIILALIGLILNTMYVMTSESNRRFRVFVNLSLLSGILDTITAFTIDFSQSIPIPINVLLNTVYLFIAALSSFSGMKYVFSTINFKSKTHTLFDYVMLFMYFVLLVVNIFSGIVFDFRDQQYHKGFLYYLAFLVNFYYILHMGMVLFTRKKFFTKRQFILFSSFFLFPFVFTTIQILFPQYLLTVFSSSITILLMLFALETPDFVELAYLRKNLEKEVEKQTAKAMERQKQIEKMNYETVEALAGAIDAKDEYTRGHSARVSKISVLMATKLGWSEEKIKSIKTASLLHDIGKIGIPDVVLQKPAKLTVPEFEIIKEHTVKGGNILHKVTALPLAETVATYHHERYDGNGYPNGLRGKNIPEFARIVTIADSYDAMASRRVYRDRLSQEEICRRLIECRGTQFDPDFLDVFLDLLYNGDIQNGIEEL